MDEGLQEICEGMNVDFHALYEKVLKIGTGLSADMSPQLTPYEWEVVKAALEVAGGI